MGRLFVKGQLSIGATVMPSPGETHYLKDVLRLTPGDLIVLADEGGHEFRARLATRSGRRIILDIVEEMPPRPEPFISISLFVGLVKGRKIERIVRDAAQLGVSSLTPFLSSRTIPRDIGDMKLLRMKKIAGEESRLARRNRPLEVLSPLTFPEAIAAREGFSVILWENEVRYIGEVLSEQRDLPRAVSIFTGPEGGFSEPEIALARAAGLAAARLGGRILRAETAPLVAAAIIQYEWGDL